MELPASGSLKGGPGLTKVVISDAGPGRYLPLLEDLAAGDGARLDRLVAAAAASKLLVDRFGSTDIDPSSATFDASRYQREDGGLALLPYSSSDLELSALTAIVAPDMVDRAHLASYLRYIRSNVDETPERQMFALAGLAAIGESVLPAIQAAAAQPDLTIREQLMIGLGAAAIGDTATAHTIETALITTYGEQQGQQARLRAGPSASSISNATALMAVLAADLGDSRAPLFWAYVEANPERDQLHVLQAVAYVSGTLDRTAVVPASFAYTLDGTRTAIDLTNGRAYELSVTAVQLAGLKIEGTKGTVGVTTSWREPLVAASAKADPDLTISRTISPSATIGEADLVSVLITVTFGPQAASGCHEVTDLVPSGLVPVGSLLGWVDPYSDEPVAISAEIRPYDQTRSAVSFCADPSEHRGSVVLRYFARVVTPGTYSWEPAIAESRSQDGRVSLTAATEVVIR